MSVPTLSKKQLASLCQQFAMLIGAGISLENGMEMILEDCTEPALQKVLGDIQQSLEKGDSLAGAFASIPQMPHYLVHMMKIGELSGKQDSVLTQLGDYYEREIQISQNIKNAIRYPLIMIFMMVIVVGVLVIKVMPVFQRVYHQLGSELEGFSLGIMYAGQLLSRYAVVFVVFLILMAVFGAYCANTEKGKILLQNIMNNFFLTKKISTKVAAARFCSALHLMLSSGIDSEESLEILEQLTVHPQFKQKIMQCRQHMHQGDNLETALNKSKLFSGLNASLIGIGFKTGNIDQVMENLSQKLFAETEDEINYKISLLEPTLVAVFSVIVGVILLSVILPLIGIMSAMGV